jgi:hypothetical protein
MALATSTGVSILRHEQVDDLLDLPLTSASISTMVITCWATVRIVLADGTTADIEDKLPALGIDARGPGEVVHLKCEVTEPGPDERVHRPVPTLSGNDRRAQHGRSPA